MLGLLRRAREESAPPKRWDAQEKLRVEPAAVSAALHSRALRAWKRVDTEDAGVTHKRLGFTTVKPAILVTRGMFRERSWVATFSEVTS